MDKKIAILIDSTTVLDKKFKEQNNIFVAPMSINFSNVSYKELGDLNKLTQDVFNRINENKEMPKTSQPSSQDFIDVYTEIKNKGFNKILCFHITQKLSGTVQGSKNAANIFLEENKDIEIKIFDSKSVAQLIGLPLYEITNIIRDKKDISDKEIEEIIDYYSENSNVFLTVATLDYLALGGRMKSSVAVLGNLFGITPILKINRGEIMEFEKVRTRKKAYKKILELFEKELHDNPGNYIIGVAPVLADKDAHKILNMLRKIGGDRVETLFETTPLTPVIANHTGPGSLGILWVKKRN